MPAASAGAWLAAAAFASSCLLVVSVVVLLVLVGLGDPQDLFWCCDALQGFAGAIHRQGMHAIGNSGLADVFGACLPRRSICEFLR